MPRSGRLVGWWTWLVALGAGLALGWSFVDFRCWMLPWLAVAPLVALAEGASPKRAFALGWVGGTAGIALAFLWLIHAFRVFGGFGLPVAVVLFVLPVAWMGMQLGVFAGAVAWLGPVPLALGPPLTFTVVEFLFPTLFPWRIAHTQHRVAPLLQSAEIAGPYLLGFVIVWCNASFVRFVRGGERAAPIAALVSLVVLGAAGMYRERTVDALRAAAPRLRDGVVQGNVGVERKGNRAFFRRNLDDYRRLSWELADDVDLLVWPETVAQRPIDTTGRAPEKEAHPFPDTPRPLVFGGLAIGDGPEGSRLFNSAFLTEPGGAIVGRYDKRVLVPFGEYLPLADRFPWLRRLSPASGRFTPGDASKVLTTSGGVRIGPLICYEDVIPGPAREAVARGATLLLNLTNDAWYGATAEPYQHQALAEWRAVETRRDFVRATNTGLTTAVSASGAMLMELPIFEARAQRVDVRLLEMETWYARHGDVFAWTLVIVWVLVAWRQRAVHVER